MRSVSLIHTVLASLLWCAAVFVFAGVNFMKYESAARLLRETRIKTALVDLQKTMQLEMDKGESLAELKTAEKELLLYGQEETDLISATVFDARSGKALFDTVPSQTGRNVPDLWRKKCASTDTAFIEKEEKKEIAGIPLFNAVSERVGCLTGVYSPDAGNAVREEMMGTALSRAFRLAGIGVSVCFLVYFYGLLVSTVLTDKKSRGLTVLILCQVMLCCALYLNAKATFVSFENDLEREIAVKARLVAKLTAKKISRIIQKGVPFDSITALEAYMEQLRLDNREILFVLVTDKTGRVLYEAGKAAEAFEADSHTGKISLKEGYYNAAEPVNREKNAVGWVQIGVNERFVREKVF